jgi:hypothetical protein
VGTRVRGEIILKVKNLIDKNQSWFWTNRWQQGEEKTDEDIQASRISRFPDANNAVSFLKKQAGTKSPKTKKVSKEY